MVSIGRRYFVMIFTLVGIVFVTTQCGGDEGVSSQIEYEMIPKKLIVIDTDFTWREEDGDGDPDTFEVHTVEAPWVQWSYTAKNNSNKTVTIVGFTITLTGQKDGQDVVGTWDLAPQELDESLTYFEEMGPGEKADYLTGVRWFLYGIPEADSFSYAVKVEVHGWVGKFDEPGERLVGSFSGSTE